MKQKHIPVLLKEVLSYLSLKPGENCLDCTFGAGGYSMAIAGAVMPGGEVLAIDADPQAVEKGKELLKRKNISNVNLTLGNFRYLEKIISEKKNKNFTFDAIVFDLGLSSDQLENEDRGFSFRYDSELDMRFDQKNGRLSAVSIINKWSERELTRVLKEYGEERYAKSIARGIVNARKNKIIKTNFELVSIIKESVPASYTHQKLHFATRTFQALRLVVNDEIVALGESLPQMLKFLSPGGRIAIVSFHSLEDRVVKNFFRKESRDCICPPEAPICVCGHKKVLKILNKKVIVPSEKEIKENPRSRSAKLRVAQKI